MVGVSERWARTDEQIGLMHTARNRGGICAWCGRDVDDGETVYVERFTIGAKRPSWHGGVNYRATAHAPVGAECASPELLEQTAGRSPEPCAGCGRGVFYRQSRPLRQQALCSRRCAGRAVAAQSKARAGHR